jgi:hypothetical protein
LSVTPNGISEIAQRQEAARELAGMLDWRQGFQMEAMSAENSVQNPDDLYKWAEEANSFYSRKILILTVKILPLLTVSLLIASFIFKPIQLYIPVLLICAQIMLLLLKLNETSRILGGLDKYADSIQAYQKMLHAFETTEFQAKSLRELQNRLKNCNGRSGHAQLCDLERVVDIVSIRRSELYLVINILLLWDYRCLIALERWKRNSGRFLRQWIEVLGTMEALSSVASVYFDHPDWALPAISGEAPSIFASQLGHPLIDDRICNDLDPIRRGQVLLVTGSNMSGKSTLLRTVGISLVLAYAGAPVCAREFCCGIYEIYTSMRVRDDLERKISSFYAELIRIKRIVDATKSGRPVFFLLDEIFKGTNSRDRHTGAKLLIMQLSRQGALGIVSTHDLELADLAKEEHRIRNYHFREYYRDNHIYFDYKLRPGVATTRNAIYLMRMAGITIDD